jgi:outer membrane protein assembly factor BamB
MRQLKGFFNLTESNTLRNLVGCVLVIILFGLMNSPMHPVVGEYRYVPDLPIPDHPPCPLGSDCAIVHTCSPGPDPEFTTGWTATGSNRMMSSPHVVDLTGDGIQDIVVGTGIEEAVTGSIIALDGSNGTLLWETNASGEMFASAQFSHLDGDETMDVILGGRNHQLFAISGSNGSVIWQFDSENEEREQWFQFYTGLFIDDQNQDGVQDWLTSNGGDPTKGPTAPRDNGYLMIISGATGEILAVVDTPDGRETYMSPLLYQPHPLMETEVLFGTGGETWDGGLWTTSIDAIMAGDITDAIRIVDPSPGVAKGVMAPPSIADMNLDGIQDLIVSTFDGRLIALDGRNYSEIWVIDVKEHTSGGGIMDAESWSSPAIGYFTDDAVPDVFTHYVIGAFPMYTGSASLLIDGATGDVLWMQDTNHTSFTSPLAVNLDGDGRDEILMIRGAGELFSGNEAHTFHNTASALNTCGMNLTNLYNRDYMSIGTPIIVDLDSDGDLELIATTTTGYSSSSASWTVTRMDLNASTPDYLSWAAYMGTNYDGVHESG